MLFDQARIWVQAGGGGDGCLSFRREAHVPRGGPDGGDGGRGGDVVLICEDSLRDLQSFRRRTHHRAGRGGHGEGALRHGARGADLLIGVAPGTQVRSEDGTVHDLLIPGQRALVARGGSGGRGNKRFASSTRQAPRFAERGLPGQDGWLDLRLKLLADVGLVGLPNAGKSSLLSRLTRAAPRIAGYPFTTLEPVLGTLEHDGRQLVLADIPGLIEGASAGAGLGHEFLAHVERTRLLVHVVELAPLDGSDPAANHAVVERELASHDPRLASLPRVLVLSKADLLAPEIALQAQREWQARLRDAGAGGGVGDAGDPRVLVTSSATGQGLLELSGMLFAAIAPDRAPSESPAPGASPPVPEAEQLAEHRVFRPGAGRGFEVTRTGPRSFAVRGERVARLLARFDIDNDEAMAHVESRLRQYGVIGELERQGFSPGDDLEIAGVALELDPDF